MLKILTLHSLLPNPLSGDKIIVGVGSTTFSFISPSIPQKLEYTSGDGVFSYTNRFFKC